MSEARLPVYTVGHSTRTIDEFVELLRCGAVGLVIDIRTVPRSRTNPQYNADVLGSRLESFQITYLRIAELGGLRGRSQTVPPQVNGYWENQSFHNYADYALTSVSFAEGLAKLEALASNRSTAMMCSEAVWWRCHRRIVADYLLLHDATVLHLMGKDRVDAATMTPAARERGGRLAYPAP